jgi:hypothetical protein
VTPLTILCITKAEPHAGPFLDDMAEAADTLQASLVIAADGQDAYDRLIDYDYDYLMRVDSQGYLESVHDEALASCPEGYVLRLDDDERISPKMLAWLKGGFYRSEPIWKFARAHFFGTEGLIVTNPPLWPDVQTRLGKKQYMGGRTAIHCGNPSGGGVEAPVYLEHFKFLIKTLADREAIVERYDRVSPGCGTSFAAFSVPEKVIEKFNYAEPTDGDTHGVKV